MVTDLSLDKEALKSALSTMVSLAADRDVVQRFREPLDLSERRACELTRQSRSTLRYASRERVIAGLEERLLHYAAERPRFGYKRLTILLRRGEFCVNHQRVDRMYTERGLRCTGSNIASRVSGKLGISDLKGARATTRPRLTHPLVVAVRNKTLQT